MASLVKSSLKVKFINAMTNDSVDVIPISAGQLIVDKNWDLYFDYNGTRHIVSYSTSKLSKSNEIAIRSLATSVSELDESLSNMQDYIDSIYMLEGAIDKIYNARAKNITSKEDMDALFVEWWETVETPTTSKNDLLWRWFGTVLDDDRIHGVKIPRYSTSTSHICELTDDSVGLRCTPSTASTANVDDFAGLPQFWCCEVAVDKNSDGTHTIVGVEFIDELSDIRNGEHLCWVLQKNTFRKEWTEGGYDYLKIKCKINEGETGWMQWPQGQDKQGTVYPYIGNPKYFAGKKNCSDGSNITCGTGLEPYNFISHTSGVNLWRQKGSHMSGASGNLLRWQLDMVRLKYGVKGNSSTIAGCHSYNYQYKAAISEDNVESIVLTENQAANLLVGSCISLGEASSSGSTDRGNSTMYNICRNKRIQSMQSVVIDGTTYTRVYIDNGGTTFSTVANTTYISTMPYWSGWNDNVLGNDGSRVSYNTGKEPGLIQKTEFMIGAYLIVSDELLQWGKDTDDNYTFDIYVCHDQSLVSGSSITSDYVKVNDATLIFPSTTSTSWHWDYVGDTYNGEGSNEILWPNDHSASGSGVGVQAGFIVYVAASGVRASWCCGDLGYGGYASLACRISGDTVGTAGWYGVLGSPGLAG